MNDRLGDLRVLITRDDSGWYAVGLDLYFAEQGTSARDVRQRFERSLTDTLREHLRLRGDILELMCFAPRSDLLEYYAAAAAEQRFHLRVGDASSLLPEGAKVTFFDKIRYLTQYDTTWS